MMRFNPPSSGFASSAVFLSASFWGLYWIPLRYLEEQGLDGAWAIVALNLPAAVVLALVACWKWRAQKGHFQQAILIGILTGFGLALYASGLVYSSVVRVTLLFYLTPVWATLIGILRLGEQTSWQRWVAIAGGLAGLALLVSGGGSVPLNIGDLFAFLSGVFWAIGASMIKRYNDVPLPGMTSFQFFFTAIGAIALGYVAGFLELPSKELFIQTMPAASVVSVLIILPAVLILFWAQKFLFPGRVGLLMMSEVLTAVITASIFLPEERMSLIAWAGAALIIGACLIEVFLTPNENVDSAYT